MKIEHLAIWCNNLESMVKFYTTYFGLTRNELYFNPTKQFSSYFLSFPDQSATRLELMEMPNIVDNKNMRGRLLGFTHIAISVGCKETVDTLTEKLRGDGYKVIGEPRITGDGYYESVTEDPEGNWIEITI